MLKQRCECAPASSSAPEPPLPSPAASPPARDEVRIAGARFAMGDGFGEGYFSDGETPVHEVALSDFSIDATTVTNAQFAAFVAATRFATTAERVGGSAVFHLDVTAGPGDLDARDGGRWWRYVAGAHWRRPGGRGSDLAGLDDHPVVHVSHDDARAYCRWAGRDLPSEAQWECAARGGLAGTRFPWGDELEPGGRHRANLWQGDFPHRNTGADGWITTAPVRSYAPNGYGLWQVCGNVWEWCADWFHPGWYGRGPSRDPAGPGTGRARVIRGGSFLCHASYCNRYRLAARSANTPASATSHTGFRTVSPRTGEVRKSA